jgi:hypothetical protein
MFDMFTVFTTVARGHVPSFPESRQMELYVRFRRGKCSTGANLSRRKGTSLGGLQFANPNIAVADGVTVVLQSERELLRTGGVGRAHVVAGGAG